MQNSQYWKKRFETLEDESYKNSQRYIEDVEKQFRQAQNNIAMDTERWYQRLADNNEISLAAARRLLKKNELEEFRWDVEKYVEMGEKNAVDQEWMKELENASARVHIQKLEAMKFQLQRHVEILYAKYHNGVTDHLNRSYVDRFYHTAFEIQKGTGIGSNLAKLDKREIDRIITTPWAADGKNFSDRIWNNKVKLVNELHRELTQSLIRGDDPQKAINNLAKNLSTSRMNAGRLIMTETAAISSAAQNDCFKELDVEEFEIVATLDSHTSKICRNMDGKHFPLSQYEVGVTAPPFHVWCRSTTVPYFDDEFDHVGERAARDEGKDKTYYVPADMTYEGWKKSFVDGDRKEKINVPGAELQNKTETFFDRNGVKKQIENLRADRDTKQKKLELLSEEEKILTQKCYFDMTGTSDEMNRLRSVVNEKKNLQTTIEECSADILEKQNLYKTDVEKEILNSGIIKEIKLSRTMTPETVDEIESVLYSLNDKYGKMPEGVIFNPVKVGDGTASYNWLDDKMYLSNKMCDSKKYKEIVQQAEGSLKEYREHYKIVERAQKDIEEADKILNNAGIKGYEREKARIKKARAEIALNTSKQAERENISDVITHEYGHFIHRHANVDYVQKKNVYGAKELGGKMIGGDWKYDINTQYSTAGMVNASKISKYATENPYETFAEGFLALDKGKKIPDTIENVIKSAMEKAGVKNIDKMSNNAIIKLSDEELGAIMRYKSFDSYKINDALRNTENIANLTDEDQQFIGLLDKALSKIPTYSGNLVRTVDFSDRQDADEQIKKFVYSYIPGKTVVVDQYWSTSKTEGYSETPSVKFYIQDSKKGRDISAIGLNESEVLYERKSKFEVIAKQLDSKEVWNILLREVE